MFTLKKLLILTFSTSLTLTTSTDTLASTAKTLSDPLPDAHATSTAPTPTPDYETLEAKFPRMFRGFSATDFPLVEKYRHCQNPFEKDRELLPKFQKLQDALETLDNPDLATLQGDITKIIADDAQHTMMHYRIMLAKTAIALSTHTEAEEHFFKGAGFSKPYGIIKHTAIEDTLWDSIQKFLNKKNHDTQGDFRTTYHRDFNDRTDTIDDILEAGPFNSAPYFMLCTQSSEDIFGLYYLAMTYYRGIHPVPVTTAGEDDKLHGIHMSEWGKFCHDLAHSEIDQSDHSVGQFANNILKA